MTRAQPDSVPLWSNSSLRKNLQIEKEWEFERQTVEAVSLLQEGRKICLYKPSSKTLLSLNPKDLCQQKRRRCTTPHPGTISSPQGKPAENVCRTFHLPLPRLRFTSSHHLSLWRLQITCSISIQMSELNSHVMPAILPQVLKPRASAQTPPTLLLVPTGLTPTHPN